MKSWEEIRQDFPILNVKVNGKPLVYLDSAASSQKPVQVLQSYCGFCEQRYANVHRGIHTLGESATSDYEGARQTIAKFVNAPTSDGMIFTRGTTESINLVARSYGHKFIKHGQAIVLTPLEHHANLIPWQLVAKATGAELRFWPLKEDGTLDFEKGHKLIDGSVAMLCFAHVSNVLGTINPAKEMIELAHKAGAKVLVDGAQAVPHMPVDLTDLGADFYAFSGHKMLGPTGIGILWGRPEVLNDMDPFLTGGEMIREVWLDHATWNEIPYKFEAGTPAIAEAVSMAAAARYLSEIGMERVHQHGEDLAKLAYARLSEIDDLTVYGPVEERGALVTFNIEGIHPHDIAAILDGEGVAIRAGHHCAQPLMRWLEVPATARASFYLYNSESDIDALVEAIKTTKRVLAHA